MIDFARTRSPRGLGSDQITDQARAAVAPLQLDLDDLLLGRGIDLAVVAVAAVMEPRRPALLEAPQVPINRPPRDPEGVGFLRLYYLPAQDRLHEFFSSIRRSLSRIG